MLTSILKTSLVLSILTSTLSYANTVTRHFREQKDTRGNSNLTVTQPIDSAVWISPKKDTTQSNVSFWRFKKTFTSDGSKLTFDVSADERYILFLDGKLIARGPHRGTANNWMYETFEVTPSVGEHCFEAVVYKLGESAPLAQHTLKLGFIFKADGSYNDQLTTGVADWKVGEVGNIVPTNNENFGWGCGGVWKCTGNGFHVTMPKTWESTRKVSNKSRKAVDWGLRYDQWILYPSPLPSQTENYITIDKNITIPPNTKKTIIKDLGDYYCAYPILKTSGGKGSTVNWGWAESLYVKNGHKGDKGNRNESENKIFKGTTDTYCMDGQSNAEFTLPWWRPGRWCKIDIETKDAPLVINEIAMIESRYPLEDEGSFESNDTTLPDVTKICMRGMQMCAHEMLFDCPYYEQQMYPGDTRVQLSLMKAITRDNRMHRRVMDIYDFGKRDNGMIAMNWPTRMLQESSSYTMCYILMYDDYLKWNEINYPWLKARFPGFMFTMNALKYYENKDGLLVNLPGWCFMDWVPKWEREAKGVAPDGESKTNPSSLNNLFWVLSMQTASCVAEALGEKEIAKYWSDRAAKTGKKIVEIFWDKKRNMVADTVDFSSYSEHAQSLAILSGILSPEQEKLAFNALLTEKDLHRATVYFSYYLFETYFKFGRGDLFLKRLDLWRDYVKMGLKTPLESPDVPGKHYARSDCHAWGSHPIYFMRAGLAGIRPDALGFSRVKIEPHPGDLKFIKTTLPHPKGEISVDLKFENGKATGKISSPVPGRFIFNGKEIPFEKELSL